jgi:hypothetical protein
MISNIPRLIGTHDTMRRRGRRRVGGRDWENTGGSVALNRRDSDAQSLSASIRGLPIVMSLASLKRSEEIMMYQRIAGSSVQRQNGVKQRSEPISLNRSSRDLYRGDRPLDTCMTFENPMEMYTAVWISYSGISFAPS